MIGGCCHCVVGILCVTSIDLHPTINPCAIGGVVIFKFMYGCEWRKQFEPSFFKDFVSTFY